MTADEGAGSPRRDDDDDPQAASNPSPRAAPPSGPALRPGMVVLGKLRVVRPIGAGGMGTVYEVEHELTRHRRALKVLHAHVTAQPNVLERFLREASAAARVGNSHVAETYDAGRLESGEPYLLMELVDGETLDQRLQRLGPMPAGELAEIIHQACDGIQAAHDAGIVHRDLKPENLIVTLRDQVPFVKILDFGISKFDAERTGALGLTAEGLLMGTPYYMSPEQVRGVSILDARTDIYSLGVILYECACGVRPFDAKTVEALAVAIHEGKAMPLAERRRSLSPEFCAIVERTMAAEREARFETASALAAALAPLRVHTLRVPMTSVPPRAVVRASVRPGVQSGTNRSSLPPSTDAGLTATMGGGSAPRRPSMSLVVAAGVAVLAAAGGVVLAARSRPPPSTSPSPAVGSAEPLAPPPVVLAPLEMTPPAASAPAAPSTAPPDAGTVSVRPPAGIGSAAPRPTGKSRVDQTGLAGENPFK